MNYSDIYSSRIHITEDLSVTVVFLGHTRISRDQSGLFLCVTSWDLLEVIQHVLDSYCQLLKGGSLVCFLKTETKRGFEVGEQKNKCIDPQHHPKSTYIKPTARHNAVDLFVGQLGAVEAQAPGHLLHYFRVVEAFIRKPSQSVHLPHKNPWVYKESGNDIKHTYDAGTKDYTCNRSGKQSGNWKKNMLVVVLTHRTPICPTCCWTCSRGEPQEATSAQETWNLLSLCTRHLRHTYSSGKKCSDCLLITLKRTNTTVQKSSEGQKFSQLLYLKYQS